MLYQFQIYTAKLIGGLNSETILCYVLVYCIIMASSYNMIMYLS